MDPLSVPSARQVATDPTQAWFWDPEWQRGEREADADLAAGRTVAFASGEELLAALRALAEQPQDQH